MEAPGGYCQVWWIGIPSRSLILILGGQLLRYQLTVLEDTSLNDRTLTNVPSADYRLYLAYGDTYDENAGILLKSLHFE